MPEEALFVPERQKAEQADRFDMGPLPEIR